MPQLPEFASDDDWVAYYLLQAPEMTDSVWEKHQEIIASVRLAEAARSNGNRGAGRKEKPALRLKRTARQSLESSSDGETPSAPASV